MPAGPPLQGSAHGVGQFAADLGQGTGTGLSRSRRTLGHTAKTRHQKRPAETGGRNGASIAKFRTRRPAHICQTSRYRAVFERPSYVTRWRRTGRLRRRDSNLCISKSDLLNFTVQTGSWAAGQRLRLFLRVLPAHLQFEMRTCESCPWAESLGEFPILKCRGSTPPAPARFRRCGAGGLRTRFGRGIFPAAGSLPATRRKS
jgi:hypothetical protein